MTKNRFILKLKNMGKPVIFVMVLLGLIELTAFGLLHTFISYKTVQVPAQIHYDSLNWFSGYHYHPYLGYVWDIDPGKDKPSGPRIFRLGVVGGSFAQNISNFMTSDEGRSLIRRKLKDSGQDRRFDEVVVINMAAGATKQPQALLASLLYMDRVDAFVGIEGYNEVMVLHNTCLPVSWPALVYNFDPSLSTPAQTRGILLRRVYNFLYFLSERGISTSRLLFYFFESRLFKLIRFVQYGMAEDMAKLPICANAPHLDEEETYVAAKNTWFDALKKQHRILDTFGKPLFTFLQPNQYLPGTKPWSEDEKKIFALDKRLADSSSKRYGMAAKEYTTLAAQNPNWIDLTTIYKDHSETLYVDNCCHVNERGERIFVEAMWPYIVQEMMNVQK